MEPAGRLRAAGWLFFFSFAKSTRPAAGQFVPQLADFPTPTSCDAAWLKPFAGFYFASPNFVVKQSAAVTRTAYLSILHNLSDSPMNNSLTTSDRQQC
jgi:hypothetical protein